jgi:glycosyltransferase domain-containing protein
MREPDFVDECYAGKDLSLLKKLTLVIPTYNRNYYLSRCLWYHAHFPFGEIIVADSSPEEKKVVNRETVAKVREMFGANVRYLEYEPETEKYGGDIYRKWGDAIQHVETEYSQICADKEFLIPTTQNSIILFLEQNSDYHVADGNFYQVIHDSKNRPTLNAWRPKQFSLDNDNPVIRLMEAMNKCAHPLMSIHVSIYHKLIYAQYLEAKIVSLAFGEIYLELLDIIMNKQFHNRDIPYLYRDMTEGYLNNHPNLLNSSFMRYPRAHMLPVEVFGCDRQALIERLFDYYSSFGKLPKEHFVKIIDQYNYTRWKHGHRLMSINIINNIWCCSPNWLKYYTKVILEIVASNSYQKTQRAVNSPESQCIFDAINKLYKYAKDDLPMDLI